jgi:hypothetical protein
MSANVQAFSYFASKFPEQRSNAFRNAFAGLVVVCDDSPSEEKPATLRNRDPQERALIAF